MKIWRTCTRAFASFVLAAIIVLPAAAQETTAGIRGKVIDANGSPIANAEVVVLDDRTGIRRQFATNNSGNFLAARLPVGGPYSVVVNNNKTVEIPYISLGETYNLTINLQEQAAIEEIVAIGSAARLVETAPGPQSNFDFAEINQAVAINRDIKDVYAIDPRINVDGGGDRGIGINCAGKSPRFNNITLDGVSQTDRFGLNNNGYGTATGQPFPFDAIQQVSVELAPFDVTYGGFSACNINAVTRSGTNEFVGNFFFEYTDQELLNDQLNGNPVIQPDYEEEKFGFSVGGPIIEDKLFFFAAYEEAELPEFLAAGPAGSGIGEVRTWLPQADFERVGEIARNIYNYDPGTAPGNGTQTDEKYLIKLDWNINDSHNLALIHNYYDGVENRGSDNDFDEFEFSNHFYDKGAESITTTAILQSQWTDQFSTELFYSMNEMNDSQVTVGDPAFGDHQISYNGRDNTIYLGADDSRQANSLNTESTFLKLKGQYLLGDHVLTFGYEAEELDVFNLFVQESRGGEFDYFDDSQSNPAFCDALDAQARFDDPVCGTSGIDKFELGRPSAIFYDSAGGSNDPNDAAASFSNTNHALYIQDELYFDDYNLSIVAGLRYEWFTSDDTPLFNQAVTDVIGVRNDSGLDGIDLVQPRIGFTWEPIPELDIRGGFGLYSGGNPNVWLSNAWSNDGITSVGTTRRFTPDRDPDTNDSCDVENTPGAGIAADCSAYRDSVLDGSIPLMGDGRPGYNATQSQFDEVAAVSLTDGSIEGVVLLDPNYEQPSEWKFAVGSTWRSPIWDITFETDLMLTRLQDAAYYVDLSQEVVGQTAAGQPIYDFVNGEENFMLTNSSVDSDALVFSMLMSKEFDWGLDLRLGYAYTDSEDISPMTSSVASSNFNAGATNDINNPGAGRSNYLTEHRFTFRAGYSDTLFGDNLTRVTLMGFIKSGQPVNFVQSSSDLEGDGFFGRHLIYIPTGDDDPNVVFESGFNEILFNNWVDGNGFARGEFLERNAVNSRWTTRWDLRVDQEIPLFSDELKARAFVKIFNVGNLLSRNWGRQYDAPFFSQVVVDSSIDDQGRYVYEEFNSDNVNPSELDTFQSLWEMRVGFEINFN